MVGNLSLQKQQIREDLVADTKQEENSTKEDDTKEEETPLPEDETPTNQDENLPEQDENHNMHEVSSNTGPDENPTKED